jgi:hypothetical protein
MLLVIPAHTLILEFKCPTVVSVGLTATYWSAGAPVTNCLSVTGAVSLSWNVIGAGVVALLHVNTKSPTTAATADESALLLTAVIISFQKA